MWGVNGNGVRGKEKVGRWCGRITRDRESKRTVRDILEVDNFVLLLNDQIIYLGI